MNITLSYNIKGLSINKALDTIMLAKSSFYKFIRIAKSVNSADDSNSSNESERKTVNVVAKSKRGRKISEFTNRIIRINENIDKNSSSNNFNNNQKAYLNPLNINPVNPDSIISSSSKEIVISVPDTTVKNDIKDLLSKEFVCYGYKKVAKFLKKNLGYIINPKKVYRLMKEMLILLPKIRPASIDIIRVKNRKIHLVRPNELWQIDIKYLYIHGEKRNSYVCTIIDCATQGSNSLLSWEALFK